MKEHSRISWLRFLVLLYGLAFCLLLVTALVTACALSYPELGLVEVTRLVRDYLSRYGITVGLLLVILRNSTLILHACICLRIEFRCRIGDSMTKPQISPFFQLFINHVNTKWLDQEDSFTEEERNEAFFFLMEESIEKNE